MLKHLPNAMTCGNLLCGCIGIYAVLAPNPDEGIVATDQFQNLCIGSILILLAAILDFGDGFVARLVNAQSAIGKELDSLADMVTFGVLPAFMLMKLLKSAFIEQQYGGNVQVYDASRLTFTNTNSLITDLLPLSIAVFSALRLAKFNVDTRQSDQFIGVPTPANALLVASLPLILVYQRAYQGIILNPYVLIAYIIVMSYLLVAELPLMAFKFKSFGWKENRVKYGFLIASVLLLVLLQFAAVPLIIALYILLSVLTNKQQTAPVNH